MDIEKIGGAFSLNLGDPKGGRGRIASWDGLLSNYGAKNKKYFFECRLIAGKYISPWFGVRYSDLYIIYYKHNSRQLLDERAILIRDRYNEGKEFQYSLKKLELNADTIIQAMNTFNKKFPRNDAIHYNEDDYRIGDNRDERAAMTIACVLISEAARFEIIRNAINHFLRTGESINLEDFDEVVRNWSKTRDDKGFATTERLLNYLGDPYRRNLAKYE